jgi:uncharacterized protein (TIGR00725 family)
MEIKSPQIAIAAHSGPYPQEAEERARAFVREVSKCGPTLILGGYWGLMKVVVDEAAALGLKTVLILPMEHEAVEPPTGVILIRTGMEYRARSVPLVRSSDALVALGGEAGTMIEALMAYAMGKPVIVLTGLGFSSDKLELAFPNAFDRRMTAQVTYTNDVRLAAQAACSGRSPPPASSWVGEDV